MSQGEPVPWAEAMRVADALVEILRPACERIEVAGSLRRRRPMVRDIEIVAEPRFETRPDGMFDSVEVDLLDELVRDGLRLESIRARPVASHRADGSVAWQTRLGPAYKALEATGLPVDLFAVLPPASWGVIFALRTGPGEWNTRLVTDCKGIGRRVSGGQVERWDGRGWVVVPTPEEADFFAAIGQAWVDPRDRAADLVRIRRP